MALASAKGRSYSDALPPVDSILPFVAAACLVTLAPGPDNLGIISLGLTQGRKAGIGFALGCALGCLSHTLWAALGVAALVAASELAFNILKYVGAAYLLWLGIKALRSRGAQLSDAPPDSGSRFLVRGFIANAINPKVALFFLAFLPQFVAPGPGVALRMVVLGLVFTGVTLAIFVPLGWFSGAIGTWLRRNPNAGWWLDRLTGVLFIGLAVRLALVQRT